MATNRKRQIHVERHPMQTLACSIPCLGRPPLPRWFAHRTHEMLRESIGMLHASLRGWRWCVGAQHRGTILFARALPSTVTTGRRALAASLWPVHREPARRAAPVGIRPICIRIARHGASCSVAFRHTLATKPIHEYTRIAHNPYHRMWKTNLAGDLRSALAQPA